MSVRTILIFIMTLWSSSILFVEGNAGVTKNCLRKIGLTREQVAIHSYSRERVKCFYSCYLYRMVIIENQKIFPGGFRRAYKYKLPSKAIDKVESRCHRRRIVRSPEEGSCDFGFRLFQCYLSLKKAYFNDINLIPY